MTRKETRESYAKRLQRVVEHIWANLDQPLDLNQLADIACLSPYHFHRVYRAMIGETVTETLSRSRLHRASKHRSLHHARTGPKPPSTPHRRCSTQGPTSRDWRRL